MPVQIKSCPGVDSGGRVCLSAWCAGRTGLLLISSGYPEISSRVHRCCLSPVTDSRISDSLLRVQTTGRCLRALRPGFSSKMSGSDPFFLRLSFDLEVLT